jgi:hypothetical protein
MNLVFKVIIGWIFAFGVGSFVYLANADEQRTNRIIENPVQDGNLVMRINDGGVKKDVFTITGSTASTTIGPNAAGSTLVLSKTGDTPSLQFEGGVGSDFSLDVLSGSLRFYNDGGTARGTVSQTGDWTLGNSIETNGIKFTRTSGDSTGNVDCPALNSAGFNSASEICIASWNSSGVAQACTVDGGSSNIHLCLQLR